jgi:hypothetical protein
MRSLVVNFGYCRVVAKSCSPQGATECRARFICNFVGVSKLFEVLAAILWISNKRELKVGRLRSLAY